MELPGGLPGPVRRHLETAGAPDPARVSFAGRGAIRGLLTTARGVWFPLPYRAALVPGTEYALEGRARLLALLRVRIAEEYRNGRGRIAVGRRVQQGAGADRSGFAMLWLWTFLLAPGALVRRADVGWELVDATSARMVFRFGAETWEATLRFADDTGLLARVETHRFELRTGSHRRFVLAVDGYREAGGALRPASVEGSWDGTAALRLALATIDEA